MGIFGQPEQQKVICNKCEKEISLKRTDEYTSEMCECVGENTQILVAGNKTKKIKDLVLDEEIVSLNLMTGKNQLKKIKRIIKMKAEKYLVISTALGKLNITHNHPLYSENKWIKAGNLIPNKKIQGFNTITKIKGIEEKYESVTVYNLEVEDNHNYFAENILSKNCGIMIWYPPKQGRPYGMRTWISKEEYLKSKQKKKEHKEHQEDMKKAKVSKKTIGDCKVGRNILQEPSKKDEQKIREFEEKKADVGI